MRKKKTVAPVMKVEVHNTEYKYDIDAKGNLSFEKGRQYVTDTSGKVIRRIGRKRNK